MARIAYVSADFGVPVFGRKGCSIHVQEVLRALARRGARLELFTTNADGQPPEGLPEVSVHSLPRPTTRDAARREADALAGNEVLRAELEQAGPFDFVYERYSLWTYAAMEYAQATQIPGLLEINAPLIDEQAQYRVLVNRAGAEAVAERAFAAASAILAVSHEVAAWVERFPGSRGKIHVVPNGVSPERFAKAASAGFPGADDKFTVGFVGTLKAWHGLSALVEAFALLHARHPATRLLIVGDGPESANLKADLAARGLENAAQLTGAVSAAEVPALLAAMDVAVAPYPKLDQFYFSPLKVYEYLAAGRPVVASRLGQLETLIENEVTGLLVAPGDAQALAGALERILSEPGLGQRLGQNGRQKVVREHTWDNVAERLFKLAGLEPRVGQQAGSAVSA